MTTGPAVGAAAPEVTLLRTDGSEAGLGELIGGRPTVLFFLRHYGWIACHDQVAQLRLDKPGYAERGVQAYAVTTGTPADSATFCRRFEVPFPCLVDHPGEPSYRAFGLEKVGLVRLFGPSIVTSLVTLVKRLGEVSNPNSGDVYQLSGTFVLDGAGTVRLAHRSQYPNDHVSSEDIWACLDDLSDPRSGPPG